MGERDTRKKWWRRRRNSGKNTRMLKEDVLNPFLIKTRARVACGGPATVGLRAGLLCLVGRGRCRAG